MSHPSHPKCPSCGLSLYKSPVKGAKVKPSDPWKFCRNAHCSSFSGEELVSVEKAVERVPRRKRPLKIPKVLENAVKKIPVEPPKPAEPAENPHVALARKQIRVVLETITKGKEPVAIGLILAVLNQETGNYDAANSLIEKYDLEKLFGFKKLSERTK